MQIFDQFSDLHQAWVTRWEREGQRKTWEREGTMERLRQRRGTKSRLGKGKETEQELRVPLGAWTNGHYCCMSQIRCDRCVAGSCCLGTVCWVWDWCLKWAMKIKRLDFGDWEFGIRIGYWDWGLRLRIFIGDLDRILRLGKKCFGTSSRE